MTSKQARKIAAWVTAGDISGFVRPMDPESPSEPYWPISAPLGRRKEPPAPRPNDLDDHDDYHSRD